jgi:hypothetical protein
VNFLSNKNRFKPGKLVVANLTRLINALEMSKKSSLAKTILIGLDGQYPGTSSTMIGVGGSVDVSFSLDSEFVVSQFCSSSKFFPFQVPYYVVYYIYVRTGVTSQRRM